MDNNDQAKGVGSEYHRTKSLCIAAGTGECCHSLVPSGPAHTPPPRKPCGGVTGHALFDYTYKEEGMKVRVDEDLCVGCGTCVEICPEIFELEDDIAKIKIGNNDLPAQYEGTCKEAADACPVEAIITEP